MKKLKTFPLLTILALMISPLLYAEPLDETLSLLNDPQARKNLTDKDPEAKKADQNLKSLGLPAAEEQKVYHLSGQIFQKITEENNGDSDRITERVNHLIQNPASIEKELTDEQKKVIHELGTESEAAKSTPLTHP